MANKAKKGEQMTGWVGGAPIGGLLYICCNRTIEVKWFLCYNSFLIWKFMAIRCTSQSWQGSWAEGTGACPAKIWNLIWINLFTWIIILLSEHYYLYYLKNDLVIWRIIILKLFSVLWLTHPWLRPKDIFSMVLALEPSKFQSRTAAWQRVDSHSFHVRPCLLEHWQGLCYFCHGSRAITLKPKALYIVCLCDKLDYKRCRAAIEELDIVQRKPCWRGPSHARFTRRSRRAAADAGPPRPPRSPPPRPPPPPPPPSPL